MYESQANQKGAMMAAQPLAYQGHEKNKDNPLGRSPMEQRLARQEEIVQELTAAVDAMQTRLQTLSRGQTLGIANVANVPQEARPAQAPVIEQMDNINERLRRQIGGITSFLSTLDI